MVGRKKKKSTFAYGAALSVRIPRIDNDSYRYRGAQFRFIGMDEVTHLSPTNWTDSYSHVLESPSGLPKLAIRFRGAAKPGEEITVNSHIERVNLVEGEEYIWKNYFCGRDRNIR